MNRGIAFYHAELLMGGFEDVKLRCSIVCGLLMSYAIRGLGVVH